MERRAWFEKYRRGGLAYRGVEEEGKEGEEARAFTTTPVVGAVDVVEGQVNGRGDTAVERESAITVGQQPAVPEQQATRQDVNEKNSFPRAGRPPAHSETGSASKKTIAPRTLKRKEPHQAPCVSSHERPTNLPLPSETRIVLIDSENQEEEAEGRW